MTPSLTDFDSDVQRLWSLLFTIVLDGEKRLSAYLAAHHLTPPQFYVLKTLGEQGGRCPIGEIARLHHLTNATMTGLIKRLEMMGLVSREQRAADRRSVDVILTASGQERFLAVQLDLMEQVRAMFSLLSAEERQQLLRYIARYVEIVGAQFPMDTLQT